MKPIKLLAIVEATSITGPAKNLLEFAGHATAHDVFTTIATFTRGVAKNQFTDAVGELSRRHPGIELAALSEKGPFDFSTLRLLRELCARVRPDVLQTHAVKSHFLVRSAGLPRTVAWVAFHHGYTWPTFRARAYNQLDRWSLRSARKVLTVSGPFRDQLAAFGVHPGRIEIIHNAIPAGWGSRACDPAESTALRRSMGIPPDRKVVLIVGRLSREKDHLTLLEAVNRIRPMFPLHLVIVGDGPEKIRIEQKLRELAMADCVTLTGHRSSAEAFYGIADIAVLSSLSEGSPNALLEAMATGVPVVSTAVGGVPEIVSHEDSALLIQPSDAQSMSEAIARLLSEPGLADRLRSRSRQLIMSRHAPEARTQKLVSIYRSLVETSSHSS